MDFDTWWRVTGQLDEGGKDDWRECWDAAVATERERCAQVVRDFPHWIGPHAKRELLAAMLPGA